MTRTVVIGIGNPGPQYEETFHNVGLMFIDWLAKEHGVTWNKRDHASYADDRDWHNIMLGKTATFMNESGIGVRELLDYRKLHDARIIIVHDDTDLELGAVKLVEGGGAAGHKGVMSVYEELPKIKVWRLKIGARPERFSGSPHIKSENFVLNRLGPEEKELLYTTGFSHAETLLEKTLSGESV